MQLNQRTAMRPLVSWDLLFPTTRLENDFGLVPCGVERVLTAESCEAKKCGLIPMSPWNHIQSLAFTACVRTMGASNAMSVVFIVSIL
jgi:hypothetical protein